MEVAHNLEDLKEYVSLWGLRENRREYPRYKVDIPGNYYIERKGSIVVRAVCRLVDVNKEGVAIALDTVPFTRGTRLLLQFFAGHNTVDVVGKAVRIKKEEAGGYLVGIQSINKQLDIAKQLLGG